MGLMHDFIIEFKDEDDSFKSVIFSYIMASLFYALIKVATLFFGVPRLISLMKGTMRSKWINIRQS